MQTLHFSLILDQRALSPKFYNTYVKSKCVRESASSVTRSRFQRFVRGPRNCVAEQSGNFLLLLDEYLLALHRALYRRENMIMIGINFLFLGRSELSSALRGRSQWPRQVRAAWL